MACKLNMYFPCETVSDEEQNYSESIHRPLLLNPFVNVI